MKNVFFLFAAALVPGLSGLANLAHSFHAPPVAKTPTQLYNKYCSSCHGLDGQAKTAKAKYNHARNLGDPKWQDEVSDERIFNSIMNGRNVHGNMPAFSKKLSEREGDSLVKFVRGLRKVVSAAAMGKHS